jgi:hypothetical protein
MKPKTKTKAPIKTARTDTRTSVSFDRVVWDIIHRQMELRGFNNNLSGYLADLACREEERSLNPVPLRKVAGGGGGGDAALTDTAVTLAAREIIHRAAKKVSGDDHSHAASSGLEFLARAGESPAPEIQGFQPAIAAAPHSASQLPANPPAANHPPASV